MIGVLAAHQASNVDVDSFHPDSHFCLTRIGTHTFPSATMDGLSESQRVTLDHTLKDLVKAVKDLKQEISSQSLVLKTIYDDGKNKLLRIKPRRFFQFYPMACTAG